VKYIADEVDHVLAHLLQWMKPVPVTTPFILVPSHAQVRFEPLGVGLIIGTWNYPVMLTLSPLIAAISGGNTAVIKPSEVAVATADVIARRVPEYLDRGAFSVVLGAAPETTALLDQQWDHIFFTGGTTVAKIVMSAAVKTLTPVVLELGALTASMCPRDEECRGRRDATFIGRNSNENRNASGGCAKCPLVQIRIGGRRGSGKGRIRKPMRRVPHGRRGEEWVRPVIGASHRASLRGAQRL
jgi:Aldehyde dehydrogenase family